MQSCKKRIWSLGQAVHLPLVLCDLELDAPTSVNVVDRPDSLRAWACHDSMVKCRAHEEDDLSGKNGASWPTHAGFGGFVWHSLDPSFKSGKSFKISC